MAQNAAKSNSLQFTRKWIRKYVESLHDPKVVSLSDSQYRDWDRLLLIAAKSADGTLPSLRAVACELRCTESHAFGAIGELIDAGLIDVVQYVPTPVYKPHGWDARQYICDGKDPTVASRMRRYRKTKKRNSNRNAVVSDTENPSESVSVSVSPRTKVVVIHGDEGNSLGGDGSVRVGGGK